MINKLKKFLIEQKKTISVAESLTSGNIQSILASVNGASSFFLGGITAYNIDIKKQFFHFDYDKALSCECVSEEVALSMAKGITDIMGSDYGIGTTGFAVPNDNVGVGYAYICIYNKLTQKNIISRLENSLDLDRVEFQKYISHSAISILFNNLSKLN